MSGTFKLIGNLSALCRGFGRDERGATAIEYAMIASGIGATVAATIYSVGTDVKTHLYDKIANGFN